MSITCKQLRLKEDSVQGIIKQLGSDNGDGLVSLEHIREQVLKAKEFEKPNVTEDISKDEINTNKMNEKSTGRESWEIDSGAHDLSGDPTLQQVMSVANSKGQSRSSNFLELANTVS